MTTLEGYNLGGEYEWLRERIGSLRAGGHGEARAVDWLGEGRVLGAARDETGRVELFITGPEVVASKAEVRAAMDHGNWSDASGMTVSATRLRLPGAPYFDQVAAFICAELLRNGVVDDHAAAFSRTESIIALAFRRARQGDSFTLGLAGELLLLRALLGSAQPSQRPDILQSWKGAGRTTRDFQLGPVGVEVKTTTGSASEHHIHGLAQIELGQSVDGEPETDLFLFSAGVQWLDVGLTYGESVAGLVDQISAILAEPSRAEFAEAVESYGSASAADNGLRSSPHFERPFSITFVRLYDMSDPAIKLPGTEDFAAHEHLVKDSLAFRVLLPSRIDGDVNPSVGLAPSVDRLLVRARYAGH
ncbi:PD-(D/E)XK motif protein [Demequina sp. NBRC 110056]|uniref:PD-(D/E)XK motif protein n=1 Tax=Demequina sp. NBRC 110056 TaxID=1570345 RepID=UPI000A005799|nr:PD-(D/E)XK motif protein [Demequina sp. NBRC 110056]